MTSLVQRAHQLEEAFLGGLEDAQNAYEEIVATTAWTTLGYDSFAEWWEARVRPAMRALSMRPTREIAASVVERVRGEEAELPPAQRRTQRELADMAGVSQGAPAIRPRSTPERSLSGTDLDDKDPWWCQECGHHWPPEPGESNRCPECDGRGGFYPPSATTAADPLPAAAKEWIGNRIAEKARPEPIQPPDPAVREQHARDSEDQKMREVHSRDLARCVWLLAERSRRVDAADHELSQWQADQDIYPEPTTAKRLRMAGDFLHALAERWSE